MKITVEQNKDVYNGGMYQLKKIQREEKRLKELELYLDSIVGKILFKEERKELIEKFGIRDKKGRLLKSIKVLNASLEERNSDYEIIKREDELTRKIIWIIVKIK